MSGCITGFHTSVAWAGQALLGDKGRIMSKTGEYMNINLERRDNKDFSHFDNKSQRGFTKSASYNRCDIMALNALVATPE